MLGQRIDALVFIPAHPVESTAAVDITREEDVPVIQLFKRVQHAQTVDVLLDYVSGVDFALRSIRPGAIRSVAYIDDDLANSDHSKRGAWRHLFENFPGERFSTVTAFRSGATQKASFEIALSKLNCAPFPDLIVVSSSAALPFVVDHIERDQAAVARPLILCLDCLDSDLKTEKASIASLEFPMSATAKAVMERVIAALNDEDIRRETVPIPPILNLSQL